MFFFQREREGEREYLTLRSSHSCLCKSVTFCFKLYDNSSLSLCLINQLIIGGYLEE